MNPFVRRHEKSVIGMISGFDRVRFRGTLMDVACVQQMALYLRRIGVLLKDFKQYALSVTHRVRQATEQLVASAGRRLVYVRDSRQPKDDMARQIAEEDGIRQGLICVLVAQEACYTYTVRGNRKTRRLELRPDRPACLHYYHYLIHPELGFLHVRVQTWLPLTLHVCINGREWLARQMDRAGIGYRRDRNCFLDIEDVGGAQHLLEEQLKVNWPSMLGALAGQVNPAFAGIFAGRPVSYYWSAEQSEWASDVMFKSAGALARLYPWLIRHGMVCLSSREVMRFLGRKVPAQGGVNGNFQGQVVTDIKHRPEGVRIRHRLNRNSVKMYDKSGSVLRVETTIHDARDMKVYRAPEGRPDGRKRWYPLRKGVSDLYRRTQVCQAANEQYLEAMASVEPGVSLRELAEPLCRRARWKRKYFRALHPWSAEDAALLEAIHRGEFTIRGFRNREIRQLLYGDEEGVSPGEIRRRSSAVTRKLRLLRAHRVIRKMPRTHRYKLTRKGRAAAAALLLARELDTTQLASAA
jgi:hypothetical protein